MLVPPIWLFDTRPLSQTIVRGSPNDSFLKNSTFDNFYSFKNILHDLFSFERARNKLQKRLDILLAEFYDQVFIRAFEITNKIYEALFLFYYE